MLIWINIQLHKYSPCSSLLYFHFIIYCILSELFGVVFGRIDSLYVVDEYYYIKLLMRNISSALLIFTYMKNISPPLKYFYGLNPLRLQ